MSDRLIPDYVAWNLTRIPSPIRSSFKSNASGIRVQIQKQSVVKHIAFAPYGSRMALLAAVSTGLALAVPFAQATSLSWTSAGTSTLGGTGTWNTSATKWWNGATAAAWSDTTGTSDIANFGGTAGTVTQGTNLGALGLSFTTTGYTIALGAIKRSNGSPPASV
jgi:hypothetical protein